MQVFKCERCKINFNRRQFQKYCSTKCYSETKVKIRHSKVCLHCGIEFLIKRPKTVFSKYCSKKCTHIAKIGIKLERKVKTTFLDKNCVGCSKVFKVSKNDKVASNRKYCSATCYQTDSLERVTSLGKSNLKYSDEEIKIRNLEAGRRSYRKNIEKRLFYYRKLAYKRRGVAGTFTQEEWLSVLNKQSNICVGCNEKMLKPTIDHIIPISKWDEWIKTHPRNYNCNDIQNIQALCKSCNSSKSNKLI